MTDSEFLTFSVLMFAAFLSSAWVAKSHLAFAERLSSAKGGTSDGTSDLRASLALRYRIADVLVWLGGLAAWLLTRG